MPKQIPFQRAGYPLLQGKVSTAQDTDHVRRASSCCFYFQVKKEPQIGVTTPGA